MFYKLNKLDKAFSDTTTKSDEKKKMFESISSQKSI